ncbi:MAG: hypothetical protein ACJ8G3_21855 [Burkholderiaceae bacterium]
MPVGKLPEMLRGCTGDPAAAGAISIPIHNLPGEAGGFSPAGLGGGLEQHAATPASNESIAPLLMTIPNVGRQKKMRFDRTLWVGMGVRQ